MSTEGHLRAGLRALVEFDDQGRVVICSGAVLTLYFRHGHRPEVRQAVLDCVHEYLGAHGDNLHWWVTEGRKFSPVKALVDRSMSKYLLSAKFDVPGTDLNWAFLWHGGKGKEEASPYQIYGFGSSREDDEHIGNLSFLSMTLPLPVSLEEASRFKEMALRWIERLRPFHGYGGAAVIASPDRGVAVKHEGRIVHHTRRHPGIEADFPLLHSIFTRQAIKGVNWITVLCDPLVEKLGGPEVFGAQLSGQFTLHRHGGGVTIVAGEFPAIGDRQGWPRRCIPHSIGSSIRSVRRTIQGSVPRCRDSMPRHFRRG